VAAGGAEPGRRAPVAEQLATTLDFLVGTGYLP